MIGSKLYTSNAISGVTSETPAQSWQKKHQYSIATPATRQKYYFDISLRGIHRFALATSAPKLLPHFKLPILEVDEDRLRARVRRAVNSRTAAEHLYNCVNNTLAISIRSAYQYNVVVFHSWVSCFPTNWTTQGCGKTLDVDAAHHTVAQFGNNICQRCLRTRTASHAKGLVFWLCKQYFRWHLHCTGCRSGRVLKTCLSSSLENGHSSVLKQLIAT